MDRLILWDIDGTLLRGGAVSGTVFADAVTAVTGVAAHGHGVDFGGKTDPQIAREILGVLDLHDHDRHLPGILAELERGIADARDEIREKGLVLPGVVDLLGALAGDAGTVQTVLTGNTAANAAVKIDAFELRPWLDLEVGAFGSDNHDRNALVPVAVGRAVDRYGPVASDDVWVIGDTPNDAACARAGGVRCLLVATGHASRQALDAAGADRVLHDLTDTAAVLQLLSATNGGQSRSS